MQHGEATGQGRRAVPRTQCAALHAPPGTSPSLPRDS